MTYPKPALHYILLVPTENWAYIKTAILKLNNYANMPPSTNYTKDGITVYHFRLMFENHTCIVVRINISYESAENT